MLVRWLRVDCSLSILGFKCLCANACTYATVIFDFSYLQTFQLLTLFPFSFCTFCSLSARKFYLFCYDILKFLYYSFLFYVWFRCSLLCITPSRLVTFLKQFSVCYTNAFLQLSGLGLNSAKIHG